MLPPRDEDEAVRLIMEMESFYREAMAGFEEDDVFYEGELDDYIETPEGMEITIPTTARAVVDEAVDNAAPDDILVHYPPRAVSRKAEEEADAVRRWVRGLWQHWRTECGDIDVIRDFQKNLFKSGKACFKVCPDWFLWPQLADDEIEELKAEGDDKVAERVADIKRLRAGHTPIFCRSVAPQCIMEDPTVAARKLWIIERYEASVEEVRNTYSVYYEDFRDYRFVSSLPIHEIWTATYFDHAGKLHKGKHFVFVNWRLEVEEENPYDELPYVVKYSGYGRESYEGRPEHKAVGFYTRQNKSMFLAEARRFTHFDAIMSQLAFPIGFLDDSLSDTDISLAPGALNFIPQDVLESVSKMWVTPEIPHPEYLQSLSVIAAQIERGTVQRALRGAGVPGTDSAAQYNTLANQSKMRITSVKQATEQAMARVSAMALRFVDTIFGDNVSVFVAENPSQSFTVGPDKIRGRYTVGITFKPNEESEKERKLIIVNDAITKGGLSPYDAYVFAGFDNPMELIARKLAYDMMQEPTIKRALAKRQLALWGEDADQLELEEQMSEGQKQTILREFMNQLASGSMRGVPDPMTGGAPAAEQQAQPAQAPPQASMAMPPGAPAGAAMGQLQGTMQDIQQLQVA